MKRQNKPLELFTNYEDFLDKILAEKGYYAKDTTDHKQNCEAIYNPRVDLKKNKVTYTALVYPFWRIEEVKFEIEVE